MSLAPAVPLLDFPSLDAQLVHNVYLFMSNKSPQPSALVIFLHRHYHANYLHNREALSARKGVGGEACICAPPPR